MPNGCQERIGGTINKLMTANQSAGWLPVITRSFHNIGSQQKKLLVRNLLVRKIHLCKLIK